MFYGTLIKDKVPDNCVKDGLNCNYAIVQSDELYHNLLKDKLRDVVSIYLQSDTLQNLAEVVLALDGLCTENEENLTSIHDALVRADGEYRKRYVALYEPVVAHPNVSHVHSSDSCDCNDAEEHSCRCNH